MLSRVKILPMTIGTARAFVLENHRHSGAPQGGLFAVGICLDGQTVGVAIAGRPVAPALQDGYTIEITRVCTIGHKNGCSMLYGAIRKAGKALGYRRFITYTRFDESGSSLRAAGFTATGKTIAREWVGGNKRNRWLPGMYQPPGDMVDRVRWEST